MTLRTLKVSVPVFVALMFQSGYGAPSFWARSFQHAVHGDQQAAVREIVNNGFDHRLQVIDPIKIPTNIRKTFPIVEQKVIDKEEETNSIGVYEFKQHIDLCEVVSFDIFDTLLLRPYVRPTDLFVHLERLENVQGFAQARIEAERRARRKNADKADISFEDIYSEIGVEYKAFQKKELELERQVLTVNSEMKEVFDYACNQGRRVIITSDMYLPESFLREVLEEKGYTGFDKIYVSSEYGKTKGTGSLFEYILKNEKIENSAEVLHIGDSDYADKKGSKKAGLTAIRYQTRLDKLLSRDKRAKMFFDQHRHNLDASILLGMLAISDYSDNYWQNFGYTYGGPVVLGYMQWLDKHAQKDDRKEILFVARDGYTLEKVFNVIKTNDARTHYVYAPRRLSKLINFDYMFEGVSELNMILKYYSSKNEFLKKNTPVFCGVEEGIRFINENKSIYMELVEKERQKYARYFDQFELEDEKLIVVDSISGRLSAQRAIGSTLNTKDIEGCYWRLWERSNEEEPYQISTYQSNNNERFFYELGYSGIHYDCTDAAS